MKNITLDGYEYTLIFKQPTTMNAFYVYRISQVINQTSQSPEFFLSSAELSDFQITIHTLNELKARIRPQFFEGFFNDEFTAVLMAKNIAMNRYIELQKSALDEAEMTITKAKKEELNKHSSDITWEGYDAYNRYYAAQDVLRKEARDRLLALKMK